MPSIVTMPLPACYRLFLRAASLFVPGRERCAWRAVRESNLSNWWLLAERGAVIGGGRELLQETFAEAARARWNVEALRECVRSPWCPLAATGAAVVLTLLLSGGLPATHALVAALRRAAAEGPGDLVVGHLLVLAFALAAGVVTALAADRPLRRHSCRYWAFLAAKCSSTTGALTLVWIEGSASIRAHGPGDQLGALLGGVFPALAFIAAVGYAMAWCFADQSRRCPVCLRRVRMPVRLGSWASVFEPAATGFLCAEGHGMLWLPQSEVAAPAQWLNWGGGPATAARRV